MSKVFYVALLGTLLFFQLAKIKRKIDYVKSKAFSGTESIAVSKAFSFDIFGGFGAVVPLAIFATAVAIFLALLPCIFSSGLDYTSPTFYSDFFGEGMGKVCAALGLMDAALFAIFFWPNFFEVIIFGLIALLIGALYCLVAGFDPSQTVVFVNHTIQNQIIQFISFVRHWP